MEKMYVNIAQTKIETDNVEALSQEACKTLQCGDKVIKISSSGTKHGYEVAYKSDTILGFVYCDYETIEEIYYEKGSTGWAFVEKHVRSFDAAE